MPIHFIGDTIYCICYIFRAVGNKVYGTQYRSSIVESVRRAAEQCDCLQCFFLIHSMGGGKIEIVSFRKLLLHSF